MTKRELKKKLKDLRWKGIRYFNAHFNLLEDYLDREEGIIKLENKLINFEEHLIKLENKITKEDKD